MRHPKHAGRRFRIIGWTPFVTLALLSGCVASSTTPEEGWQRPDKWHRVRMSMSKQEVLDILGKPTSQLLGYSYEYRGQVRGTGLVEGRVLFDPGNRVVHVEVPHFWHAYAGPDDPKGNVDANGEQIRKSRRTTESFWETSASSADSK